MAVSPSLSQIVLDSRGPVSRYREIRTWCWSHGKYCLNTDVCIVEAKERWAFMTKSHHHFHEANEHMKAKELAERAHKAEFKAEKKEKLIKTLFDE